MIGGPRTNEPASNLAVAAAIIFSVRAVFVCAGAMLIGEIGLVGELCMVRQMPAGLRKGEHWPGSVEVSKARLLCEALKFAFLNGR